MSRSSTVEPIPDVKGISFTPPRWISWLIALVPVFPPLYLAAFGCLGLLRILPLNARYVLFFFVSTQLIASLFTPRPLLSLGLAAIRTLFILAMISAGAYLKDSRNLRPLLWGQLAIFATAWGYTILTQGLDGIQARLGHPYYYVVSLGLVSAISLWIIIFWQGGKLWWRIPVGAFAGLTFFATGSRGPLLALIFGSLFAVNFRKLSKQRYWFLIPIALVSAVALNSSLGVKFQPILRLFNDQVSGRDVIWQDSIIGWKTSPIGGVGAYQGGPYLTYLFKDGCQLTPTLERNSIRCPEILTRWSSVWLIAHNAWLHWLLESGILGLTGLIAIMTYSLWQALRQNNQLNLAILCGFTIMNVVDVVIAVPSPHFAELWWVIVGISLYRPEERILIRGNAIKL